MIKHLTIIIASILLLVFIALALSGCVVPPITRDWGPCDLNNPKMPECDLLEYIYLKNKLAREKALRAMTPEERKAFLEREKAQRDYSEELDNPYR